MSRVKAHNSFIAACTAGCIVAGGFVAHHALAADRGPTILESGSNDIIQVKRNAVPEEGLVIARLSPSITEAPQPANSQIALNASRSNPNLRKSARSKQLGISRATRSRVGVSAAPKKPIGVLSVPRPSSTGIGIGVAKPRVLPDNDALIVQPPSLPSMEQPAEVLAAPKLDAEIENRLVTICLQNAVDTNKSKAFDIQRKDQPRYIVAPGEKVCAKFEPTRHTVFFWKSNEAGQLALTLSNRLDLNDADGTQVTLNWIQD